MRVAWLSIVNVVGRRKQQGAVAVAAVASAAVMPVTAAPMSLASSSESPLSEPSAASSSEPLPWANRSSSQAGPGCSMASSIHITRPAESGHLKSESSQSLAALESTAASVLMALPESTTDSECVSGNAGMPVCDADRRVWKRVRTGEPAGDTDPDPV